MRKPGLGKGVPPPVPPNKPVVPVKKEVGKRGDVKEVLESGKQSMVTGLQGLKFGLSIGGTEKVLKPDSVPGAGVPTKKFFNNIESKSWASQYVWIFTIIYYISIEELVVNLASPGTNLARGSIITLEREEPRTYPTVVQCT